MTKNDPYSLLTQSIRTLKEPLEELMKNHDEFLLQNVQIINNVNSLPKFNLELQDGLKDTNNKKH